MLSLGEFWVTYTSILMFWQVLIYGVTWFSQSREVSSRIGRSARTLGRFIRLIRRFAPFVLDILALRHRASISSSGFESVIYGVMVVVVVGVEVDWHRGIIK